MTSGHLTDGEFASLLADESGDLRAEAHLPACAACRRELASARAATREFNGLGMAWAQVEAPRRVATPSRLALHLGGRPAWGLGLAATSLACMVAVGISLPHEPAAGISAARGSAQSPSTAELAEDNELMQSINQELKYEAAPAVPVPELKAVSHPKGDSSDLLVN